MSRSGVSGGSFHRTAAKPDFFSRIGQLIRKASVRFGRFIRLN
jgi:hypothetical protein